MNTRFFLLAGTLAVAGCATLGLDSFVQPPTFQSVDGRGSAVEVTRPTTTSPFGGARVRVWTRVRNPNQFGINLASLGGELYLENTHAADVDLPLGLPLLATQDTVIPVDFLVDFAELPRLARVVQNAIGGGEIPYRLEGTVGVSSETFGYQEFGPGTVFSGSARVEVF